MHHRHLVARLVFTAIWVSCRLPVHGQSELSPEALTLDACTSDASTDDQQANPETSIAHMTFADFLQVPAAEQAQITASLQQHSYRGSLDEIREEVTEKILEEWQDRGYFNAKVAVEERVLTSNPSNQQIALTVSVNEGRQYRLGKIAFRNNRAISNQMALRSQFPIEDGDILSRQAIKEGLEKLRYAYAQIGFINFTSIPNTTFNETDGTISLDIEVDEGMQFYVSSIDVMGADPSVLENLMLKRGQVYNIRLIEYFLRKHFPGRDWRDPALQYRRLDEKEGTVAITFDFRQCLN
jgi:outer membrane translocation and assembly module TamA